MDTVVAEPILLGYFPATIDLTPDGLYAFVVNFNLHGEHVPSTVSVVYTPDLVEVEQIETCTMPHGARMAPDGLFLYSNCMMDEQVVEIDTRTFEVARRFSVAPGREGPLDAEGGAGRMAGGMSGMGAGAMAESQCSPTWVQPSPDGLSLYVACNAGSRILHLDRQSWELTRVLRAGTGPYNLAITPDGRMLVATLKQGAGVEFFDLPHRRKPRARAHHDHGHARGGGIPRLPLRLRQLGGRGSRAGQGGRVRPLRFLPRGRRGGRAAGRRHRLLEDGAALTSEAALPARDPDVEAGRRFGVVSPAFARRFGARLLTVRGPAAKNHISAGREQFRRFHTKRMFPCA